jgi:site-specific recombinase XerD
MWLKHRRPRPKIEEIDAVLISQYLGERAAFRSKGTVGAILGMMRMMGEYLVAQGIWPKNPLRWMRGPKLDTRSRIPRRLPTEKMNAIWKAAATGRHGYHQSMWVTVLAVLYGTGIRVGELERLDLSNWLQDEGLLLIDGRKTGYDRRVPLPELANRCLEGYLPKRNQEIERLGVDDQPALFVNKFGHRVARSAVTRALKRIAKRAGITSLQMHQFRHTCASDLLEQGVKLPEVQRLLGHRCLFSTMRYLSIADPQLHEAVKQHPINDILGVSA